jgi:hypothetical protein
VIAVLERQARLVVVKDTDGPETAKYMADILEYGSTFSRDERLALKRARDAQKITEKAEKKKVYPTNDVDRLPASMMGGGKAQFSCFVCDQPGHKSFQCPQRTKK